MSFRTTLVLVALAVILGGAVYWAEFRREKPPEPTTTAAGTSAPLWDVKPGDITAVKVAEAGGKTVELTKSGTDWQLQAPIQEPADSAGVESVLAQLASAPSNRKIEPKDVDLGQFGLATPQHVITLTTAGGTHVLNVGGQNPDKSANYVQKPNDPAVYLVPNFALSGVTGWLGQPPKQPTPTPEVTGEPGAPTVPGAPSVPGLPGAPAGTPAPTNTPTPRPTPIPLILPTATRAP